MRASSSFLRFALLAIALLCACGPGAFDNLTGGVPPITGDPDAAVIAPRPVAPISVSTIPSLRPKLRWELKGDLTGAILELCRTRACATLEKTFDVQGTELVIPEDLAPGVWYWRLRGRSGTRVGTTFSPTWQFVVRGGAKNASSTAPQQMVLDLNGDGEADVVATGITGTNAELYVWFGQPNGALPETPSFVYDRLATIAAGSSVVVGGGADVDGDGFADAYVGLQLVEDGETYGTVVPIFGGPDGIRPGQYFAELDGYDDFGRTVREAGDVNGDGYGDVIVGAVGDAFVVFGEPTYALSRTMTAIVFGDSGADESGRAVLGAFDATGDGLADVVTGTSWEDESALVSVSEEGTTMLSDDYDLGPDYEEAGQATALAAGDLDGNALAEVLVAGSNPTRSFVCLFTAFDARGAVPIDCKTSTPDKSTFGIAATSADLDGDGVEEMIVASKIPERLDLDVVRATPLIAFEPLAQPGLGAALTTIWPGRPGPARWAAASAEAEEIVVFENAAKKQVLRPPPGKTFARSIR